MSETDVDHVEPADFDFTENPSLSSQAATVKSSNPPIWIWFAVSCLLIISLFVIFVLPNIVPEYDLPLGRVGLTELQAGSESSEPAAAISPFEEAQRSLRRKEAQDVLAELLQIQGELDAVEVGQWGQAAYAAALAEAGIGDEHYRTQDFLLASESYTRSRDGLAALRETIPDVLARILIDGQHALDEADAVAAQNGFSLALLLEPENETAQIGLERARALDEVTVLLAGADALLEDGELEAARDIYRQILDLDSYNDQAQERIIQVSAMIAVNEFARIMSSGYALLESGDPEQAIAEFQRAANLGVNQEQALAAITQTANEVANARINVSRELITAAEASEQWQTAVDEYDNVLAIDANLTFAINGRDYADKRARLDQLLVFAIDNPERFAEDAVFEQTKDVYFTGRAIENPGPLLNGQLDELEVLLENSQVPIEIQLVSDGLTDVTLLRIEHLGNFEQTSVSLKPGRYVAVGRRPGYREAREEFTVGFGLTPSSVIVQCDERVIATNR